MIMLRSTVRRSSGLDIGARDDRADATTGIGKKLNGQGLTGIRTHRAAETDTLI